MKRFTETQKWADPWFRRLPCRLKLLWLFFCDNCDHAGVIDPDWELASFQIGEKVDAVDVQKLDGRIVELECGKLHIPAFVKFQFGELSRECKAHSPVFKAIERHSLPNGYPKGIHTLQEKEKDKEEERGGECRGENRELPVEMPAGFPSTFEDAKKGAGILAIADELLREIWDQAKGRGGRDGAGVLIASWPHFLSSRIAKERNRIAEQAHGNGTVAADRAVPGAPGEPEDWRDWLSMQKDEFKEKRWAEAPDYFKASFDRWQKAGSPVNKEAFAAWSLKHG